MKKTPYFFLPRLLSSLTIWAGGTWLAPHLLNHRHSARRGSRRSRVYVVEFKLDESAQTSLDQIREKRCGSPYLDQGQPVTALGVRFSSETKEGAEWEARPYAELLAEG